MAQLATRIRGPVSVIGDVHGQVDQLVSVLDQLRSRPDYDERCIVFIGDIVDRGPDTKGAMDIVCDLLVEHPRTTMVSGNHELAMAGALDLIPTPDYADWAPRWVNDYLSESTFKSYGVEHGDLEGLISALPDRHVDLLTDLPWGIEHPEFYFVHAGLDPNTPFDMQIRILRQKDYSLNRPQWLCSKSYVDLPVPGDCPVTVVSGHVQVPAVRMEQKKILIDTTGGVGGDLSCVLLPERKVISSSGNPAVEVVGESRSKKSRWKLW